MFLRYRSGKELFCAACISLRRDDGAGVGRIRKHGNDSRSGFPNQGICWNWSFSGIPAASFWFGRNRINPAFFT